MNLKSWKLAASLLLLLSFSFGACEKEETAADPTLAIETAADDDMVETFSSEVFIDAEEGAGMTFGKKSEGSFQGCATITQTITLNSRKLVIDFGTTGCEGRQGRVKKGKMIITVTGSYRTASFTKVVELENFYINDHKIEGTRTVTVALEGTTLKQTERIEDGKVTFPDGTVVLHEANRTRVLVEGAATPLNWMDDVWEITGSASGTNYKQTAYTMLITKPIRRSTTCRFALSGEQTYTVNGLSASIDFGNGACDNKATIKAGDQTKEIELGKRVKN